MLEKYLEEIEINKELLSSFPRNNIKNTKKVIEKCDELIEKYQNDLNIVLGEMEQRYNKYIKCQKNDEIEKLKEKKDDILNNLYLLDLKTPYEKSGLSRHLYNLERFFKNDLESVNKIIKEILKIFENIGVNLTISDFTYSIYTNIYMKEFLSGSNLDSLKNCFEDIYFKSPTLFKQISLNFKTLYYKNQKSFINYYNNLEKEIVLNNSKNDIYKSFLALEDKISNLIIQDEYINLNNFINGDSQIKDYAKDQITNYYNLFTTQEITDDNIEIVNEVIKKFLDSLKEYQGYLKYNYIILAMKKLYSEKDKYKNISMPKFKELSKKQLILFKTNKKVSRLLAKNNIRDKEKIEIMLNTVENLILEIDNLYKEYEENLFLENIGNLSANLNLFDTLKLSISNYNFIVKTIKNTNEDLTIEDINSQIEELENYIRTTKFTILNHINITDEKEIDYIIIDKYNLLGLNVKKEQIELENLDSLMKIAYVLLNNYYVLKQFDISNINFVLEYLKIKKNLGE